MKAKEILSLIESFVKSFNDVQYGENIFVEIFVNPSRSELVKLFSENEDMLRFIADPVEKKLYIFNGAYLHEFAYVKLPIHTPMSACLVGVVSRGLNRKLEFTLYDRFYDLRLQDWSWLDIYFGIDVNKLMRR